MRKLYAIADSVLRGVLCQRENREKGRWTACRSSLQERGSGRGAGLCAEGARPPADANSGGSEGRAWTTFRSSSFFNVRIWVSAGSGSFAVEDSSPAHPPRGSMGHRPGQWLRQASPLWTSDLSAAVIEGRQGASRAGLNLDDLCCFWSRMKLELLDVLLEVLASGSAHPMAQPCAALRGTQALRGFAWPGWEKKIGWLVIWGHAPLSSSRTLCDRVGVKLEGRDVRDNMMDGGWIESVLLVDWKRTYEPRIIPLAILLVEIKAQIWWDIIDLSHQTQSIKRLKSL
jgi:hypothetical protein